MHALHYTDSIQTFTLEIDANEYDESFPSDCQIPHSESDRKENHAGFSNLYLQIGRILDLQFAFWVRPIAVAYR